MDSLVVQVPNDSSLASVVPFPARRVVPAAPLQEVTEDELRAEVGRRFLAGELVTPCPYCGRTSMRWKPTKLKRPFGQCSSCWAQTHLKTDISEDGLLATALEVVRGEYK